MRMREMNLLSHNGVGLGRRGVRKRETERREEGGGGVGGREERRRGRERRGGGGERRGGGQRRDSSRGGRDQRNRVINRNKDTGRRADVENGAHKESQRGKPTTCLDCTRQDSEGKVNRSSVRVAELSPSAKWL
eukprot:753414-Hanusia_phi.AAC.4